MSFFEKYTGQRHSIKDRRIKYTKSYHILEKRNWIIEFGIIEIIELEFYCNLYIITILHMAWQWVIKVPVHNTEVWTILENLCMNLYKLSDIMYFL